jgi:hypothetical protein
MITFRTDKPGATTVLQDGETIGFVVKMQGGYMYNPLPEISLRSVWFQNVCDLVDYVG